MRRMKLHANMNVNNDTPRDNIPASDLVLWLAVGVDSADDAPFVKAVVVGLEPSVDGLDSVVGGSVGNALLGHLADLKAAVIAL